MSTHPATPIIDSLSADLEPLCAAHALSPLDRQGLAVASLSETNSVSELSRQHEVSRKFVAHQRDKATQALAEVFAPAVDDDPVKKIVRTCGATFVSSPWQRRTCCRLRGRDFLLMPTDRFARLWWSRQIWER